jgi:hypothetical protein
MQAGQPEDITVVLANLDAIAAVLNGGIDNTNVAAGAAIDYLKLALGNAVLHRGVARGAAPPGAPTDGDFWLFPVDAANGVNWLFRYNAGSASANKWEALPGVPVLVEDAVFRSVGGPAAYADLTGAPSFTLTRAGDYIIEDGMRAYYSVGGPGPSSQYQGIKIGAAATIDSLVDNQQAAGERWKNTSRAHRLSAVAGDLVKLQNKTDGAVTAQFGERWLKILPVRVI